MSVAKENLKEIFGFTLLELMVTISILLISMSLAVPALGGFIHNQRLRSDSGRLHMDLLFARTMALNQGQQIVVCPVESTPADKLSRSCSEEPLWENGWLVFIDANNDREYQASEHLLRIAMAMNGLTARSSLHRQKIHFFPDGSAVGSAATITICSLRDQKHARALVISNSGRVRQLQQSDGAIELDCP